MTSQQVPAVATIEESLPSRNFSVLDQRVELDVDFLSRSVLGKTYITIAPRTGDFKTVQLNCRQCRITKITVDKKAASISNYQDPYQRITPRANSTVHQYHQILPKLEPQHRYPPQPELVFNIPKSVQIVQEGVSASSTKVGNATAETPLTATAPDQTILYRPLTIEIWFEARNIRDGLQFVGCDENDGRYPHVYTQNSPYAGRACSLFPCVDDLQSRCSFELWITCARTLGDAFKTSQRFNNLSKTGKASAAPPATQETPPAAETPEYLALSDDERVMDLYVLASGSMTDEIIEPKDPSRKTTRFSCGTSVSPNQIGFAIGPFEEVDLSKFREVDDDDKLGENATRVHGFCLPGRADEVRNTCMPLAKAIDYCTTTFTTFPFPSYKICFVDDLESDVADTAGFSICSNRLLFPEDIIDPIDIVTRKLVRAVTTQYSGISIAPAEPSDSWVIIGMAGFMADLFMKTLCGNNEYRYQQKLVADEVTKLDIDRLSLSDMGQILHLDKSEAEFLSLKARAVMFILDRRLAKISGSAGLSRIVTRTLSEYKTASGDDTLLQTSLFQKRCERIGHLKLESFFEQWVHGAGCPSFVIRQEFNKKKLSIRVTINQEQAKEDLVRSVPERRDLKPENFIRDVKEESVELYVPPRKVFTGPMTLRIHEADGTPYEHIVEIKDEHTIVNIPYNTKYKRLKRSRRAKERAAASAVADGTGEAQDDVLLYCLGDTLQSDEEVNDWRLVDWTADALARMNQESYEWIRVDTDFEWIAKLEVRMPPYMYVSQLQQDRDVVAQMQTMQYLEKEQPHPLVATILVRTLMDQRYFHGIRTKAAELLARMAKEELSWLGLFQLEKAFGELFCYPGSNMTRPNDFSDRTSFLLQRAIAKSISTIKDIQGYAPMSVKQFFFDKLKFNDNSTNEYSDCHYIATLLSGLAETLVRRRNGQVISQSTADDDDDDDVAADKFKKDAIDEIQRYRRVDEWISSYQNIYSLTSLEAIELLASSGVIQPNLADFLQYTRIGNADQVRIKALDCLRKLGQLKNAAIMRYFFFTFSTDKSPFVRQSMMHVLGQGLGQIAIGEKKESNDVDMGELIVEQDEASTENRQTEFARKQSVTGAIAALKKEMEDNETFKQGLWSSIGSIRLSLHEVMELLDLCELLYDQENTLVVTLKYPRYWRIEHQGDGKVKFSKTGPFRTKPRIPWQPPVAEKPKAAPSPSPAPAKPPRTSPANSRRQSSIGRNASSGPGSASPPPLQRKPTILKLKSNSQAAASGNAVQSPVPTRPENPGRTLSLKLKHSLSDNNGIPQIVQEPSAVIKQETSTEIKQEPAYSPPPTLAHGLLGQGQMSPPPRPSSAASGSSDSSTALAVTAAARGKKRKSSEIATPQPQPEQPAPKKPMLKLKLSSSSLMGSMSQGSQGSPPPPQ